ncbi:MAG TPA: hypothetical protein VI914_03600 [Thermodesulfobacteriota bacterium]|nr:hypothetical protein [Thermodesulfobacteriota bacterium]
MPVKKILVFSAAILVFLAACGKEGKKAGEERKEDVKTTELPAELPKGHPQIEEMQKGITPAVELPSGQVQKQAGESHPKSKAELSVKVSDKIKARWKDVELEVTDASSSKGTSGKKEVVKVRVGGGIKIGDTGYSFKVEAFIPDYVIYQDSIGSKSEKPNNPAALVELFEGDKSVARGWVFKNFPAFNSYKHGRFTVALLTPSTVKK